MIKRKCIRIAVLVTGVFFVALSHPALRAAEMAESKTRLEIAGTQFTINGKPAFLHGISYYGALGARRRFVVRDLDDMQRHGFNWIRVWATWSAFDNDVSAVDNEGRVRESQMEKLKWLLTECDRRGIIVDVTLTKGEGRLGNAHVSALEKHAQALETLTSELREWRNWYLDMANEHNIRSKSLVTKFVSFEDARTLRNRVKKVDEQRLVTISYVRDPSKEDVRRYLLDVQVDFLSPHRPRNPKSARETATMTRQYLTWMREFGRLIPIHYQEPFRRDFSKGWQPTAEDFQADLEGAIEGGAAGWCFHNGDNRWGPDAEPRRSFDMRQRRLFEQLDSVELEAVKKMAAALGKAKR
ncbi:MAG: hypothetical protein HQ515_24745 [Phycisphaeraceae bacterium]|nr:hypothetical protein [Phycisphaeraceae bacterium]